MGNDLGYVAGFVEAVGHDLGYVAGFGLSHIRNNDSNRHHYDNKSPTT